MTPNSKSIPVEYIQQCFEYREEVIDGVLQGNVYWKYREDRQNSWNAQFAGKKAGTTNTRGYHATQIKYNKKNCNILLHTIVFILNKNKYPIYIIDHIDGNKTNNLIGNIEDSTLSDNANNRGADSNSSSHFRAVHYHKKRRAVKKWAARVQANGKTTTGVYFNDELEAAKYANKLLVENFSHVKNLRLNDISIGYTNKEFPNKPRWWSEEKVAA
jgi:hypothetical protein